MAKITTLPPANPLTGTEPVLVVQGGQARQTTIGALIEQLAQPYVDEAEAAADEVRTTYAAVSDKLSGVESGRLWLSFDNTGAIAWTANMRLVRRAIKDGVLSGTTDGEEYFIALFAKGPAGNKDRIVLRQKSNNAIWLDSGIVSVTYAAVGKLTRVTIISGTKKAVLWIDYSVFGAATGDFVSSTVLTPLIISKTHSELTHAPISDAHRAKYPFHPGATNVSEALSNAIKDIWLDVTDKTLRLAPAVVQRNAGAPLTWRVAIAAYDTADTLVTSVGAGGIVAEFTTTANPEPATTNGKRISRLTLTPKGAGAAIVVNQPGYIDIDWLEIPDGSNIGVGNYSQVGLHSRIFAGGVRETGTLTRSGFMTAAPRNSRIWNIANNFAVASLDKFILDAKIYGADPNKSYGIERIQIDVADPGRRFISLNEYAGNTPGVRVALFDVTAAKPAMTAEGMVETCFFAAQSGSGIYASLRVRWDVLDGQPGPNGSGTRYYYQAIPGTEARFALEYARTKKMPQVSGAQTLVYQVDGVNCQLILPTAYDPEGQPSWLAVLLLGNGQSYNFDIGATAKNYLASKNIAVLTTQGQDYVYGNALTGNPAGWAWGNYSHRRRYLKAAQHALANFNLRPSIIPIGSSMGGLIMGQWLHERPMPIAFGLGLGPVPDLSYIFANGGVSRKVPIREAYGMASDGSNDAAVETFIRGHDWFDMAGQSTIPHLHMYAGTGDSTFSVDFGGTAKYQALRDAIRSTGSFCNYTEPANANTLIHNDNGLWGAVIADGVFERELGV